MQPAPVVPGTHAGTRAAVRQLRASGYIPSMSTSPRDQRPAIRLSTLSHGAG